MAFTKAGLARGLAMNATWPVPAPAVQKAVPSDRHYHGPGPTPATTAANNTHTAATPLMELPNEHTPCRQMCSPVRGETAPEGRW